MRGDIIIAFVSTNWIMHISGHYREIPVSKIFGQSHISLWLKLMTVFFFLSIVVAQAVGGWAWLSVVIVPWGCTRLKRNFPRGFGKHVLYYLGLTKLKNLPDAFVKEFNE